MYSYAQASIITTIAGTGVAGYSVDSGLATGARLNLPFMICFDKSNENLFIADAFNHRIRKINRQTGVITTVAGNGTAGYNGDNISATDAKLYVPQGVKTDTLGNLYIVDAGNSRIRKVNAITGIITTIAGNGTTGDLGDGGPATNAQLYYPCGLGIDKNQNIYFGDYSNNKVRK